MVTSITTTITVNVNNEETTTAEDPLEVTWTNKIQVRREVTVSADPLGVTRTNQNRDTKLSNCKCRPTWDDVDQSEPK